MHRLLLFRLAIPGCGPVSRSYDFSAYHDSSGPRPAASPETAEFINVKRLLIFDPRDAASAHGGGHPVDAQLDVQLCIRTVSGSPDIAHAQ